MWLHNTLVRATQEVHLASIDQSLLSQGNNIRVLQIKIDKDEMWTIPWESRAVWRGRVHFVLAFCPEGRSQSAKCRCWVDCWGWLSWERFKGELKGGDIILLGAPPVWMTPVFLLSHKQNHTLSFPHDSLVPEVTRALGLLSDLRLRSPRV